MSQKLTGLKIRAGRKARGMTQAELARRVGISAPYVNLIESNRRPVADGLLVRIGDALGIEPSDLDGGAERRSVQALAELAADPRFGPVLAGSAGAEELVGRYPRWSDLILRLYQAYEDQRQAVVALADRLNHDPFLGESIHRMLTSASSVSSAAEILARDDLSGDERRRFAAIVHADGARLSDTATALLGFFDNAETRVRSATPSEYVDAFILAENNHFPELEALAEGHLRSRRGAEPLSSRSDPPDPSPGRTPESSRFAAMREVARDIGADAVAAIVGDHSALPNEDARQSAQATLFNYLAGAMLMPYGPFLEAAQRQRYDIDALCREFGVSYEQAAHRLATLRRPGAEGVQLAFMRSDVSGHVTKRLPLPGLALPRYATACPKWAIYEAFQAPGTIVRQYGELPSMERFLFIAKAVDKMPPRVGHPRRLMAVMLVCPADQAGSLIYADGLDPRQATIPVGTVCRLCPRDKCGYRQEDALIGAPAMPDQRRIAADSQRI